MADYVDNSPPTNKTLEAMQEQYTNRMEGYTVQVIDQWFPITDLTTRAVIGSFAINQPSIKHKFIKNGYQRFVVDTLPGTPGDIARDYLRVKFPGRKPKMNGRQWRAVCEIRRSHPLFAQPCELDEAYYIDLHAAYWSMVQVFGWDVDYSPGRFIGVRSDVEDFPFPDDKMSRNMLVTAGLVSPLRIWTGSDISTEKSFNQYVNYGLWAIVQDTLNAIAGEVVRAGAVYAFSDGYIVPMARVPVIDAILDEWGLPYRIKAKGRAVIKAAGVYKVGDHQTKRFRSGATRHISKISEHVDTRWLRRRVSAFAAHRRKLKFVGE